jgi:hypothetical protein
MFVRFPLPQGIAGLGPYFLLAIALTGFAYMLGLAGVKLSSSWHPSAVLTFHPSAVSCGE